MNQQLKEFIVKKKQILEMIEAITHNQQLSRTPFYRMAIVLLLGFMHKVKLLFGNVQKN